MTLSDLGNWVKEKGDILGQNLSLLRSSPQFTKAMPGIVQNTIQGYTNKLPTPIKTAANIAMPLYMSALKGGSALVDNQNFMERVGNILGGVGAVAAPVTSLGFGALGTGIKAGSNLLSGKPIGTDLGKTYSESVQMGTKFAGLGSMLGGVTAGLPKLAGQTGFKALGPIGGTLGRMGAKSGIGALEFGTISAMEPAKDVKERFNNFKKGFVQGAAFSALTAGFGEAFKGKFGRAIENGDYKGAQKIIDKIPETDPRKIKLRLALNKVAGEELKVKQELKVRQEQPIQAGGKITESDMFIQNMETRQLWKVPENYKKTVYEMDSSLSKNQKWHVTSGLTNEKIAGKLEVAGIADQTFIDSVMKESYKAPSSTPLALKRGTGKIELAEQPPVEGGVGGGGFITGLEKEQANIKIKPEAKVKVAEVPQTGDAQTDLLNAIKNADAKVAEQKASYTAQKGQRFAKVEEVGKTTSGVAGAKEELKQMGGLYEKVEIDALKNSLTQKTMDNIMDMGKNLQTGERLTYINTMMDLFEGKLPTESGLNVVKKILQPEVIQALLDKRPIMQQAIQAAGNALNLPRAVMATADLSAPLRQGIFLIGRPKQWIPAFKDMFRYAFSENAYQDLNRQWTVGDAMARPNAQLYNDAKLALTEIGGGAAKSEEAFVSSWLDKFPLTRASNRAYSGFLNQLRMDVFDDIYKNAVKSGAVEANPDLAWSLARFINSATGRGSLGAGVERSASLLNTALFSPRLLASRLNLLNPLYYAKLDPFVRKEALKSLFTFAATGVTVVSLAKMAGADVSTDPTNADFGKIKVGTTRIDPWGGFQQYIKLAAQLATQKVTSSTTGKEIRLGEGYKPLTSIDIVGRFFESKQSPIVSFAQGLITGQNMLGEKFNVPGEIANRFIPMVVSDMYDLYKEGGLPEMALGLPAIFGAGVQTYGTPQATMGQTAGGNPKVEFKSPSGLGEDIAAKITGAPPINILPNSAELYQNYLNKTQKDMTLEDVKRNAEAGNMTPQGTFVPITIDGKTVVIDTSFQPTQPMLTGNTELDKKAISKFNGQITQKANDIYDLYTAGKMTAEEAEKQLTDLKTLKLSTGTKKPKKISVKKITAKKLSVSNIKIKKPGKIKMAKLPKLLASKIKGKKNPLTIGKQKTSIKIKA